MRHANTTHIKLDSFLRKGKINNTKIANVTRQRNCKQYFNVVEHQTLN